MSSDEFRMDCSLISRPYTRNYVLTEILRLNCSSPSRPGGPVLTLILFSSW